MKNTATPAPVYLLRLACIFAALAITAPLSDAIAQTTARTAPRDTRTLATWEEAWLEQWFLRHAVARRGSRAPQFIEPAAVSGPSTWNGGVGNWSNGAMWTPIDPPNSAGADVFVDGGNAAASIVNVDGNFTIGRLTIDAGDTVNINDARLLVVTNSGGFAGAGTIVNNGSFTINSAGNFADLRLDSAVTLSGSGTVTLGRAAGYTGTSFARMVGGGTLTNQSTIQGEGRVGDNQTAFINSAGGIVQANVVGRALVVDPNSTGFSNAGTLRATGGGILQLSGNGGGDFVNTGTGSIQAAGADSEVQLFNSVRISGGTLATSGGGIMRVLNGHIATLDNLTNAGTFIGSDNSTTALTGSITNNGDVRITTEGNFSNLRIDGAVTLNGAGAVTLTRSGAVGSNARISGSGTLTNNSLIQGEGNVGANETAFINSAVGVIQANVAARTLILDPRNGIGTFQNLGIVRARDGGTLQLTGNGGGVFDNTGGNILAEAGSEVQFLSDVTITGGTLATSGTGAVIRTIFGHQSRLDNLTITGSYLGSDNSQTILSGTMTNNGDMRFSTDGNFTNLRIDTAVTLNGTGAVTLTRNGTVGSNARILGGGTLTNNSLIQGEGNVGSNEAAFVNSANGVVQANVAGRSLVLDPRNGAGTFENLGILRARDGGLLLLSGNGGGTFANTGGGSILAEAGSEVQLLSDVGISGGTLATNGTGAVIRTISGHQSRLTNLTNAGTYVGSDNSTTILSGTITNNGDMQFVTLGNFTNLRIDTDTSLNGTGTVTLTRGSDVGSNSRILGGGTLTNNSTIQGEGNVGANEAALINSATGVIQANVAGRSLTLDPRNGVGTFQNLGVMRARNGGTLILTGNGGGTFGNIGSILAETGSEVQLMSDVGISGGTLGSAGSGSAVRTISGHQSRLDNLTITGNYIGNDNSQTILSGTITNNGDMRIATDGNFTNLRIDSPVTLNGTGTLTLARNSNVGSNSRILGSGTLTNNSTIQGEGNAGSNETAFVNQAGGVIQANVNGRTLTLDPRVSDGLLNAGTLRASNGGTLLLTGNGGGNFTNNIAGENGTFEALDASSLFMDGSATLTNNVNGVLTRGRYRAVSTGNGATITIRGAAITQLAAATEVELSGTGSLFQVDTTALESTLTLNNGILRILGNRNYTNVNALTDNGVIELGGGIFNAPSLTIGVTGELFGLGTVNLRPTNSGLIRSSGGTLAFVNGIQGAGGTARTDAGSTMNLSGGSAGSSADFLINNGNLALGTNNFTVGLDYTNANFGVGNSFNHRANVSGTGLILAAGNVSQTLTGNLTSGSTTAPLIAFGNVHVGDAASAMFRINNSGTSGPSLRGALQTSVNGGNITDARLIGSGVLAGNWGPIALGGSSDDYTVTFNASFAGALSGQILHIGNNFDNVAGQNLSITGAAFRYANPTAHTPAPVAFGNFHVGDAAPTMFLSLTNNVANDGFSEALDAMISSTTGGVLTNNGSFSLLAPGATNNSSLSVGISTASAGSQNGTATILLQSNGSGSSGLGITNLPSQIVNVTGAVFRYANPEVNTPTTVAFGIRHVGDSVSNSLLSITNNVPADGFSESLNASIGGATGGATTNGGTFTGLAPGSTNSTSLGVGINTAAAGIQNGTATVAFVSNGAGASGLGLTNLPSQTINVTGQVNFYADPVILFTSGAATLTMNSATSYTLTFGAVEANSGTYMASLDLVNFLRDATFQDTLDGTFDISMVSNFALSGFGSFSDVGPGGTRSLGVSFDSSAPIGFYNNTISLNATSANASSTSNLAPIQLNLQAQVVPEPSTWAMLAGGAALVLAMQRFRRRKRQ